MKKNKLITIRRKANSPIKLKPTKMPYICMNTDGTFLVFKYTMRMMNIEYGDAIMFGFSKHKSKYGYVFKEKPCGNNYILRETARTYGRFRSKELMLFLRKYFNITNKENSYFLLNEEPNEEGVYKFIYENN